MSQPSEEECPICLFLQECPYPEAVDDLMEFASNKTCAVLLTNLSGSKITMTDVKNHKKHAFAHDFYEKIKKLDLNTTEGMNTFYAIDGMHHAKLNPGSTGSIAGLTAVKNLQDMEQARKEKGDLSVQLVDRLSAYLQKEKKITPAGVLNELKKIVSELN